MKRLSTRRRRIVLKLVVRICFLFLYTAIYIGLSICLPQVVQAQTGSTPYNADEEILYIDGNGTIQVIDTNHIGPALIDWSSPDTGFVDFAVGDFNADGDYEVVGIMGDAGGRQLVIYDPVVFPDAIAGSTVITSTNGIRSIELYRTVLNGRPVLIETGDFDINIPGDEIIYVTETGFLKSEVTIIARNMALPAESVNQEARNWYIHTSTAANGNFDRVWQHITTGQIDEQGADEIVLVDGTRDRSDQGIRSKIAAFRVDDGGLASMTPFFERENVDMSWRHAQIAEMNGRPGAEIATSRSLAGLLPDLHIFEYDMERGTIRDRGDGCPDKPHESLSCPDDVFALHISPSPRWVFTADINDDGQDVAFFLREVTAPTPTSASPASVRLFGIDFAETFTFNLSATLAATVTLNNVTNTYTQITNTLTVPMEHSMTALLSDGRMIARDEVTTHWATYYDISKLNDGVQGTLPSTFYEKDLLYNLWQRGAGGDTDGDGKDEVVVMRTDNIRTYAYRPDQSNNWVALRDDVVPTNNRSLKLANLDRNGTLQFAPNLAANNATYLFSAPCPPTSQANVMPSRHQIAVDSTQQINFQAYATAAQPVIQSTINAANKQGANSTTRAVPAAAPLVDWPSAVPWLRLSSPSNMAPNMLSLEVIPSGLPPNLTYHKATVYVQPSGLGTEYRRQVSVGFLCTKAQLFLPIAY